MTGVVLENTHYARIPRLDLHTHCVSLKVREDLDLVACSNMTAFPRMRLDNLRTKALSIPYFDGCVVICPYEGRTLAKTGEHKDVAVFQKS